MLNNDELYYALVSLKNQARRSKSGIDCLYSRLCDLYNGQPRKCQEHLIAFRACALLLTLGLIPGTFTSNKWMLVKPQELLLSIPGSGTNVQALINHAAAENLYSSEINLVISNKVNAFGLKRAQRPVTKVIGHRQFKSRELFDKVLDETLEDNETDIISFVFLASCGFCQMGLRGNDEDILLTFIQAYHRHSEGWVHTTEVNNLQVETEMNCAKMCNGKGKSGHHLPERQKLLGLFKGD
ncbi:unnamed protein product [Clavelina lepadiformis]